MADILKNSHVAVLVPCFNEAATIAEVVRDFREALPEAQVYVFNNASTDDTAVQAREAGATVVESPHKGKGHVVMHMFREVEADWYIMVDGDSTYSAASAPDLIRAARESEADMLVARRVTPADELSKAYRPLHQLGNQLVCSLIRTTFSSPVQDVFSGYRVFSREFVKTVPLVATGFDTEVEMTLQALSKGYRLHEVDSPYTSRPSGSFSKLNTFRDGARVLMAFFSILRDYRPRLFFGSLALAFALLSLISGIPAVLDYVNYHYVYHVPLAILATGLALLSALSMSIGLILQTQLRYHHEIFTALRRVRFSGSLPPRGTS